ncbi:MAG: 4Fe-4S binding protein, partial [Clostridiales bacterium]|nr:4Fe-4S binding protein [Clostridiales bacterium]
MDRKKIRFGIQAASTLIQNANIKGFFTGKIYEGTSKSVCVPGLNCYSCPGAIGSCPVGSLQSFLSGIKFK